MELVLKGRGARVAQRLRQVTEHKLARIERLEPALTRLEVVVTVEKNPRQGGVHRVEAAAATPRKTYRAHADAPDVDAALDVVAERLERQILDHHNRRRTRRNAGAGRVKSAQAPPTEDEADEAEAEDRDPGSTE
jgi:ribosomal subunit interface protein